MCGSVCVCRMTLAVGVCPKNVGLLGKLHFRAGEDTLQVCFSK